MEREVLLETRHLYKTYGRGASRVEAIKDLNLKVYKGETLAIIGKSGSGKSTLMHLLALLDKPTKGEIILEGKKTKKLHPWRLNKIRNRKFGFVFQSFYMNERDSVINNVLQPLRIAHARRRKAKKIANTALKVVDLYHKRTAKAKNLSGGEKQRVCIARAIVNMPEVIFADEPTGNLDSRTSEKIIDLLFHLNKKSGITLIIVTHDEDLAALCDRQIRIQDGEIKTSENTRIKRPLNTTSAIRRAPTPASIYRPITRTIQTTPVVPVAPVSTTNAPLRSAGRRVTPPRQVRATGRRVISNTSVNPSAYEVIPEKPKATASKTTKTTKKTTTRRKK